MMGSDLCIKAYAKVNLYLDVVGKRPDGYHELETVFHSIDLCDDVILRKRDDCEIRVYCNRPRVPCDARNLAYRAAKLLLDQTPDLNGVDIVIDKRIPVAAGLGGGSANAAATLWGMNQLFGLQLTTEDLMRLGKQLGADTPFCILGGAALGRGIGEALTPLPPLKEAPLALGNPGFEVPTAWVYGNLNLSLTPPRKNVKIFVRCLQDGELKQMAAHMHNSLEYPVFSQYPVVAGLKADFAAQPGGYGALMSGSGATVFALMQDHDCANRAALHFKPRLAYCTVASTSSVGLSLS